MKKFTKKQIKELKLFWDSQKELTDRHLHNLQAIESTMESMLGIEGLEFFWNDNSIVGIGTVDRKYKLIQEDEIEKGKYENNG